MTLIRVAIAAAVLIFPAAAFAAANETPAAPERPATAQVSATAEATVTQDTARDTARESDAFARAPAASPVGPAKPKAAIRPARLSVVRAAPQPSFGCSGYWCGRQFVLMLGVGY